MRSLVLLTLVCMVCSVASAEKLIGKLSTLAHGVSGDVYAKDSNTLLIKNFKYDGTGPDAFFWIGKSGKPDQTDESTTMILTTEKTYAYRDSAAPVLRAYKGETVELPMPENFKMSDLKWFSVWCRQFAVDFGHVVVPADFEITDIPHPLAPSAEPEPEPEKDDDHSDHKHDDGKPEPEPEQEPEQEPEPEPKNDDKKDGSGATHTTLAATTFAFIAASLLLS